MAPVSRAFLRRLTVTPLVCACLFPQCHSKRTDDAAFGAPNQGATSPRTISSTNGLTAPSTGNSSESGRTPVGPLSTRASDVTQELSAGENKAIEPDTNQLISYHLALVRRMRRMRPTAVPLGALSPFVKVNAERWMEKFLRREALPSSSVADVQYFAHPQGPVLLDTLISTWTWNGMQLRAFQDYEVVVVFIETPLPGSDDLPSKLSAIGTSMLRTPIVLEKRRRSAIEGEAFTTARYASPYIMFSWTDRIDAGTLEGVPFFMLYKRVAGVIRFRGPEWFPPEFRKQLKP